VDRRLTHIFATRTWQLNAKLGSLRKAVRIDGNRITDWVSFHAVFSESFGFPGFYGCNMNAWIDCMSYLDDPDSGMSKIHVAPGETLAVVVENASSLKFRCPEQLQALMECAAVVNWRAAERNCPPLVALAFDA
jgi:hypothetical protein